MQKDYNKICFFCDEIIEGKVTKEHIIPNSLLGKLKIKESKLKGFGDFQYSRIKVPAHSKCNNEYGSRYENEILTFLEKPEELYEELTKEIGIDILVHPSNSKKNLIKSWLSKIYYGLFYHHQIKSNDKNIQEVSKGILNTPNFDLTRESYKNNHGFNIPSSLFVFKSDTNEFDLQTIISPESIMIKIENLILILCIGDGELCHNYLNNESLNDIHTWINTEKQINPSLPIQQYILAEIITLRISIPKNYSHLILKNQIINMSFMTLSSNADAYYKINPKELSKNRKQVYQDLGLPI